ncbi:DUF4440 domain-containing protein [Myxococcaceae bacterium JPH2]|nr:DUF4440 domain-containing protein [Myxococcaceae bacterium JPH2]
MHRKFAGVIVTASLGAMGCSAPGATAHAGDTGALEQSARLSPTEARERLHAADVAMSEASAKSGSAQGFASFLGDESVLLVEGQYALKGREAIRAHLTAHPLEHGGTIRWTPMRWDVSADGQIGYSVGQATVDLKGADGAAKQEHARYISAWKQQADGSWRVIATVRNPAKVALTPPEGFASSHTTASAAPRTLTSAAVLAEAFAADSAFSTLSTTEGMGHAFSTYAAEDALLIAGATGLFGREAITKAYGPLTKDKLDLRWEPVLGDAATSGDLAFTVGRAKVVEPGADGKPETDFVKYLTIWRRQPDGTWRYVTDGGNSSPGPNGP